VNAPSGSSPVLVVTKQLERLLVGSQSECARWGCCGPALVALLACSDAPPLLIGLLALPPQRACCWTWTSLGQL
jgi:hypothetical protein